MNADAIKEVLALVVQGHPCEAVSFGASVTVICTNEVSAARWRERTPNGVLPDTSVPVVVEYVPMYADPVSEVRS